MKKFYCDASYSWQSTNNGENIVRGKIAIVSKDFIKCIEKVAVGKVPKLKQYINIFELIAVARAVELASLGNPKEDSIAIHTDSQVAKYWASAGKIKAKVSTEAHDNALEYLRKARIQFAGVVTFNFVPRDKNPAGKLLEIELEKEAPHAK